MAELGFVSASAPLPHRRPHPVRPAALLALLPAFLLAIPPETNGQPFRLPTANRALLTPGREAGFFAPTPGNSWTAGQYGCVRSAGTQLHEGIDILAVQRDRRGEPTDPVRASAPGSVAYVNRNPGLSNYGIYVILRHRIEGLQVYTLYAHLRAVRSGISPGAPVSAGQIIGVLGRTTNTRTPIAPYRAHLHFEIALVVNDGFARWQQAREPGTRNDHGLWNGRNFIGIDPAAVFRSQARLGSRFSLIAHLQSQREMCRILVPGSSFPWVRRYAALIRPNPTAARNGVVAYEVSLNYAGLPFRLVPRSRAEITGSLSTRLLSVNNEEATRHGCRKLVFKRGQTWVLTARARELLDLLTH